ncbi:MAG TPA: GNAT family N-acetyltransferase [bacterium]
MVHIEIAKDLNKIDIRGMNRLLSQLDDNCERIKLNDIQEIISRDSLNLYLVHEDNQLAGFGILVWYKIITGFKGWIEDVVIDQAFRGRRMGKILLLKMIEDGVKLGLEAVYLTSRPERIIANKLYQSLGFEKKDTNCFILKLKSKGAV